MVIVIGQALFFFLPSYVGNAAPVLLNRLGWFESLKKPIDGGRTFLGRPLFGRTKTWRGLWGGALAGIVVAAIQYGLYLWVPALEGWFLFSYDSPFVLLLGLLLGLGEGLGDLLKSFVKRRLGIKSSGLFFPFDQMSFLGALALGSLYFVPPAEHIIAIVVFSLIIPVIANFVAYKIGWKEVPY